MPTATGNETSRPAGIPLVQSPTVITGGPATIPEINQNTFIDRGFPLSANFLLEHCTSGAIHPLTNDIMPGLTQSLSDASYINQPRWQIVSNLSKSAIFVLEPMLREFGGGLILRQAFKIITGPNGEVQHQYGNGFDIQVAGFEANMVSLASDIQRIAKFASNLTLNFGASSWMHIGVNQTRLSVNSTSSRIELPTINTADLITGTVQSGIVAFRGLL